MKIRTTFILSLTAILTLAAGSAFGKYSGGSGDPCDPYKIADANDLLVLAADTDDYGKSFILTADIDLAGQVFTTAIIATDYSTAFTGTFDGNSHKITHFTIDGGSNYHLGLFGYINTGGSVKNLGLENCSVSGSGSWRVGGLVGSNYGSISNCYSTGAVSGYRFVGGLVGNCYYGSISNCYSTGSVSGSYYVGGLVGDNYSYSSISNSYSTGAVSGSSNSQYVGGLAGDNYSYCSISNSYSTSAVSGSSNSQYVGGLVGYNYGSSIGNCYSIGAVSGSQHVGGLVGYRDSGGSISNSYFLISSGLDNGYGTPLTDAQMKQQSSFIGWDFTNETTNGTNDYWRMCADGVDYPHLNWESIAGDFACPDGVNFVDFAYFANRWFESDCASSNNFCGGADMDSSGKVDMADLAIFAENWLWEKIPADFDIDGDVDFVDYAFFANHWMYQNCAEPDWCEGTDFDHSGSVDIFDLATFAGYWLEMKLIPN